MLDRKFWFLRKKVDAVLYVCENCIADDGLGALIDDHMEFRDCDFCETQAETPIVCEFEHIIEHMEKCFLRDFCPPPVESAAYSASGQEPFDARELFDRVDLVIENKRLLDLLTLRFDIHAWCEKRWFEKSTSDQNLHEWNRFSELAIRHYRESPVERTPRVNLTSFEHAYPGGVNILREISELGRQVGVQHGRTRFWRAQILNRDECPVIPNRFTSPPVEHATKPNRMSAAGVSMFYGADDPETAYAEIVVEPLAPDKVVWALQFELIRDTEILDLDKTHGLMRPSYFSDHGSMGLHDAWFFDSYLKEVSKPIVRDGREHEEYAPTQIMTEYFGKHMITFNQNQVEGIKYLSTKTGRPCYALFADQDQCLDDVENREKSQMLRMVEGTLHRYSMTQDSAE